METLLYIDYPSWIHPEIFPGVPLLGLIRWYGLMYIFAFATAYYLLVRQMKEGALNSPEKKVTEDDVFSFLATGIIFLLIGARVFSTLVYDTSGIYREKPWLIFWPFDTKTGVFTGLAGMSYHGGFIGGLLGLIFWCRRHKANLWKWVDCMSVAIPFGYTFGRIGNFMNGELYGRITTAPWGVIFPRAEKFSSSIEWVKNFAAEINMEVTTKIINLPRHPSQLYEALFEGIVLGTILWFIRKKKPFDGFLTAVYCTGYGFFRFFIEYFREPDADIGYRFAKEEGAALYTNTSLLNISTGQVLCFGMIAAGITLGIVLYIRNRKLKAKAE